MFETLHVKGGSEFSKCINTFFYDTVVNFASVLPDKELFCCVFNGSPARCANMSPTCPITEEFRWNIRGQCNKIGQTKFCVMNGYSTTALPGNLCGGILGNISPNNATLGTCPSYDAVGNILSTAHTAPSFSWLCCDSNNCIVPANVNVTGNIANTNCIAGQYSLMCFNDNGGWSCTGSIATAISDITKPIGDCIIQIVLNSVTSSLSSSGSLTSSLSNDGSSEIVLSTITSGSSKTFSPNQPKSSSDSSSSNYNDNSNNGLSSGTIAAIVLGCLSFIGCSIATMIAIANNNNSQPHNQTTNNYFQTTINSYQSRITNLENNFNQQSIELNQLRNERQQENQPRRTITHPRRDLLTEN